MKRRGLKKDNRKFYIIVKDLVRNTSIYTTSILGHHIMSKLITSDCNTWDDIKLQIRRLDQKALLKEYHSYVNLCAKSTKDLRLEIMLEDEVARRSVK